MAPIAPESRGEYREDTPRPTSASPSAALRSMAAPWPVLPLASSRVVKKLTSPPEELPVRLNPSPALSLACTARDSTVAPPRPEIPARKSSSLLEESVKCMPEPALRLASTPPSTAWMAPRVLVALTSRPVPPLSLKRSGWSAVPGMIAPRMSRPWLSASRSTASPSPPFPLAPPFRNTKPAVDPVLLTRALMPSPPLWSALNEPYGISAPISSKKPAPSTSMDDWRAVTLATTPAPVLLLAVPPAMPMLAVP